MIQQLKDTLKYALNEFETLNNIRFDLCVFLTCTDIFRSVNWITDAIERLENDSSLDSVFAASPTHKNYWQKDNNGKFKRVLKEMEFYSSRQEKKTIYIEKIQVLRVLPVHLFGELEKE